MTMRTLTAADLADRIRRTGRDPETVMRGCPDFAIRSLCAGRPVRNGLCRVVAERAAPVDDPRDGLTIEGHWTVFNSPTEIHSWEGAFTEQVLPGATKKTLRDAIPKMQFDHGHHPLLGSLPLGRWDQAKETDRGSWSQGRMRQNWLVEPFAQAIRAGDVDGMSFRFAVLRDKWYDVEGTEIKDEDELFDLMWWGAGDRGPLRRDLLEVSVSEAGPVVWPAYQDTNVGARSADGSRLVIDLAALTGAHRAQAGFVVAQLDAELARAEHGEPTPETDDPRTRWQPVGLAGLTRMASGSAVVAHNAAVDSTSVEYPTDEPQATGTAADHSPTRDEPGRTEQPAGEHSRSGQSARRPLTVAERDRLRTGYRAVLNRTLALPKPL